MDFEAFWALVEASRVAAPGRRARRGFLREHLAGLPVAEVVGFQVCLDRLCAAAWDWDLWGAAARIYGGWCSDDGFDDFRLWLVGCGQEVFERAVAAPDSLAEVEQVRRLAGRPRSAWDDDTEWPGWEELDYIAGDAYALMSGDDDECREEFHDLVEAVHGPDAFSRDPAGVRWSAADAEAAAARIPALAAAFPITG